MKKYMVLWLYDGETNATFFDIYKDARMFLMKAECGIGAYAEIYERLDGQYVSMEC